MKRLGPHSLAAALAAAYVIASPPSLDLAAHLLRAKLFSAEGFGIWNNWWYGGHHVVLYSVLFPALSAAITPQLAAAIAAVATAALFEPIARRHFGPDAWVGALWFGAASAISLYTGRLAFAFGLLGAVATVFALQRRWSAIAIAIARRERTLRAGVALYVVLCLVSYVITSAVGGNAARLEELLAGPLAALVLWPARKALLLAAAIPLLYLQWHAPVRDVTTAGGPAMTTAYYRPLLSFLERQPGSPFRVEIPFTKYHWEGYVVAPRFPLARGWERQLDIKYNRLFYGGALTPTSYEAWLHRLG